MADIYLPDTHGSQPAFIQIDGVCYEYIETIPKSEHRESHCWEEVTCELPEATTCEECCLPSVEYAPCTVIEWIYTDEGFIDGGQNCAYREYDHPDDVNESPWTVTNGGLTLRLDFEPDGNCAGYNNCTQTGTAAAIIELGAPAQVGITWAGMGEVEDPNFDEMTIDIDGIQVGSAHAPGGGLGCAPDAPVVSDPPPPLVVNLTAGPHALDIWCSTRDAWYHQNSWYQFTLNFS